MKRAAMALGLLLSIGGAAAAGDSEPNLPYLLRLRGDLVEVRYSPGALDRAAHVQRRFELLAALLGDMARRPARLTAWVVEPDDWERGGLSYPFGLPEPVGGWGVALPAWGDERSVALWKGLLGGPLPLAVGSPVRGSGEEAASLGLADLVAQIDAVRLVFAARSYVSDAPWATEVAVHAAARLAFARFEEGRLAEIDALFGRLAARGGEGTKSLAAWSAALAPGERLAFEGRFARGAALLLEAQSERKVRRMLARALRKGEPASAAELEELAPALVEWRRGAFAP